MVTTTAVPMEWEKRLGRRLRVRDLYIPSIVVKTGSIGKGRAGACHVSALGVGGDR